MFGKIIVAFLLGVAMLPGSVMAANANVASNNLSEPANQNVSFNNREAGTFDENYSVSTRAANNSELVPGTNIVNYNLLTQETTYESFDYRSFEKREPKRETSKSAPAYNVKTEDQPDFKLHKLEGEEIYYTNGYDPVIDYEEEKNTPVEKESEASGPDRVIIGSDDRTIVTNPKINPYIKTGFMRMTYNNIYNNNTKRYETCTATGTAFLVGPNTVLTAGHCVYGDVTKKYETDGVIYDEYEDNTYNPRFPDKVEFYFGADGIADINSNYRYYAKGVAISIEYHYFLNPGDENNENQSVFDWSVIELDREMGNNIGWYGTMFNVSASSTQVVSYGYPRDKSYATMWEEKGTISNQSEFRYYTKDIDTYGGQSGSPYILRNDPIFTGYVCGIHTFGDDRDKNNIHNGGTRINIFIQHYILSFREDCADTVQFAYEYLGLRVVKKEGNTWTIKVVNNSSACITMQYNKKMCFKGDAQNWTGLKDIEDVIIAPYDDKTEVQITENFWATSIACSYVFNGKRIISYADNLKYDSNTGGSLSQYYKVI